MDRSLAQQEIVRSFTGSLLATFTLFDLVLLFARERLADEEPEEVVRDFQFQSVSYPRVAETGQEFTPEAMERAVELSAGQPWLVNALAAEVVYELAVPAPEPVTADHVEQAKERLVLARATHLDSLAARLAEPAVHRVLAPVLAGTTARFDPYDNDLLYVRDLGLVAPTAPRPHRQPDLQRGRRAGTRRRGGGQRRRRPARLRASRRPARLSPAAARVRRVLGGTRRHTDHRRGLPRGRPAAGDDGLPATTPRWALHR